jgi:hypothetical protein
MNERNASDGPVLLRLRLHLDRARELIRSYGLGRQVRTLDALQLSVALLFHRAAPIDQIICADQRLCDIALLEGLAVINPERP